MLISSLDQPLSITAHDLKDIVHNMFTSDRLQELVPIIRQYDVVQFIHDIA